MDLMAERAVMLGAQVHGTIRAAAQGSSLEEYPLDVSADQDHVRALADRLGVFGKLVRDAIGATDALGDADTADLFTEISRSIDMQTWMVESHARR
jgi:starvation-inducible DNA-binding protein